MASSGRFPPSPGELTVRSSAVGWCAIVVLSPPGRGALCVCSAISSGHCAGQSPLLGLGSFISARPGGEGAAAARWCSRFIAILFRAVAVAAVPTPDVRWRDRMAAGGQSGCRVASGWFCPSPLPGSHCPAVRIVDPSVTGSVSFAPASLQAIVRWWGGFGSGGPSTPAGGAVFRLSLLLVGK